MIHRKCYPTIYIEIYCKYKQNIINKQHIHMTHRLPAWVVNSVNNEQSYFFYSKRTYRSIKCMYSVSVWNVTVMLVNREISVLWILITPWAIFRVDLSMDLIFNELKHVLDQSLTFYNKLLNNERERYLIILNIRLNPNLFRVSVNKIKSNVIDTMCVYCIIICLFF